MIESFTEDLVKEWSWRLDDGMPDVEDPEKLRELKNVLVEEHDVPKQVAEEQVRALISEASLPTKKDMKDDITAILKRGDFLTPDQPSGSKLLNVRQANNVDFLRRLRNHVQDEFAEMYDGAAAELYTSSGNQVDGPESDYPGGMAGGAQSRSYTSLWLELVDVDDDGNERRKGYGFKLSGQSGASADDFEAGIAIAYNLAQGDSREEAIQNAGLTESDVEGIYDEIVQVGQKVVDDLPQMGGSMEQVGSGSFDLAPDWPASRTVPKTDMYAGDQFRISLKQSGRSQLMSGGPNETEGVFLAAKKYFDRFEENAQTEVADDVLDLVRNKFSKFDADQNISDIKSKLRELWKQKRQSEIAGLSGSVLEDHIDAEMKLFNIKARRGNWKEGLVDEVAASQKEFVNWVQKQVRENDEITDVFLKAVEGSINHREIQSRMENVFEGHPDFLKWCVFEAGSGAYKFSGEPNPNTTAQPAANKVLVFDKVDGLMNWKDIDESWAKKYSGKVDVETSFKGKSKRYTSFRMAIVEDEEPAPPYARAFQAIVEQERERAAKELEVLKEQFLVREDVRSYLRSIGQKATEIAKRVFEFIQQTITNFFQNVTERFIQFAQRAADKGIEALLEFFGYEVEGTAQVDVQF